MSPFDTVPFTPNPRCPEIHDPERQGAGVLFFVYGKDRKIATKFLKQTAFCEMVERYQSNSSNRNMYVIFSIYT